MSMCEALHRLSPASYIAYIGSWLLALGVQSSNLLDLLVDVEQLAACKLKLATKIMIMLMLMLIIYCFYLILILLSQSQDR